MKIDNRDTAIGVTAARSFWARLKGLLGRSTLPSTEALLIVRCGSVHTIGMRFAIDVVFLNKHNTVLKVVETLRPQRFAMCWGATSVLEMAGGVSQQIGLREGAQLTFKGAAQ